MQSVWLLFPNFKEILYAIQFIWFYAFFPIVVLVYFIIPKCSRYIWLLVTSYYFYMIWNPRYALVLLFSTITTFVAARLMKGNRKKLVFYICILCNLLILGVFKYTDFIIHNINYILRLRGIELPWSTFDIILPIGISFYMLQALGYIIDVYQEKIVPETNFAKYALFVSFFPTILSGPIERSGNLLRQIQEGTEFSYNHAKDGMILMVWGYCVKLLVADRLAILVNTAYLNYENLTGASLAFAIVLYAIQIYCDFSGYSYISIGVARVLGFHIMDNFSQPYFATSVRDFWKRWHISLSQWFRDYVYIPLGGGNCSKMKVYRNVMITFGVSGLWHGAGWHYIVWGGLHGIYQVISRMTINIRKSIIQTFHIRTNCFAYCLWQRCITFLFIDFAWLFFRAQSLRSAMEILKKIFFEFYLEETIINRLYLLGMDWTRFKIMFIELCVILIVDIIHEKKVSIREWLNKQNWLLRWTCYLLIVMILWLGILRDYGVDAANFIYSQF